MPRKKGIDKTGWRETNFRLPDALSDRINDCALRRGWSLETCARMAMIGYAKDRIGAVLVGRDMITVARKSEGKLRNNLQRKLWVRYPPEWDEPVTQLVQANPTQVTITGVWREAIAWWVEHEEGLAKRRDRGQDASAAA